MGSKQHRLSGLLRKNFPERFPALEVTDFQIKAEFHLAFCNRCLPVHHLPSVRKGTQPLHISLLNYQK